MTPCEGLALFFAILFVAVFIIAVACAAASEQPAKQQMSQRAEEGMEDIDQLSDAYLAAVEGLLVEVDEGSS